MFVCFVMMVGCFVREVVANTLMKLIFKLAERLSYVRVTSSGHV